jgi:hypothetical protein
VPQQKATSFADDLAAVKQSGSFADDLKATTPATQPAKTEPAKEELPAWRKALAIVAPATGPLSPLVGKLAASSRKDIEDTVDLLPTAGGVAGGLIGAPGAVPGMVAGAAAGGATGEAWRQLANHWLGRDAPKTATEAAKGIAIQGGIQGAGEAVGSAVVAPALKAAAPYVKNLTKLGRATPEEAAAVKFGQSQGISVSAATATQNPVVKGAEYLADRSLVGGLVARDVAKHEAEGLTRVAGELAQRSNAGAATSPYQGGKSVTDAIKKTISDYHGAAGQEYDALRAIEKSPAAQKSVQVGTEEVTLPVTGTRVTKPVMEKMALPVDLRGPKAELKSVYDQWSRTWSPTQQQASRPFTALKNLMEGPDYAPASIVDMDLSALKSMARGASVPEARDVSQGLAAQGIASLSKAVDDAVAAGGAGATAALKAGRAATTAKHEVLELLDSVREEPVRFFQQMTATKDGAVDQLKAIAKVAPNEMPNIGRAYLEDALKQATSEGGFVKAAKLASDWNNLGPQTKEILFKSDPTLVSDLNKFFLLAKKMGEQINPSGSGSVVSQGVQLGQMGHIFYDPVTAISTQLGAGGLSKLLHSKAGVRLLTEGVTIPTKNAGRVASWTARAIALANNQKDDQ